MLRPKVRQKRNLNQTKIRRQPIILNQLLILLKYKQIDSLSKLLKNQSQTPDILILILNLKNMMTKLINNQSSTSKKHHFT